MTSSERPRAVRPRPRRRFGQHFLEAVWADKLITAIDPRPADRFLEVGPGPGALTLRLAPRVSSVTAVEVDRDMVTALAPRVPGNVRLVRGDFLETDVAQIMPPGPFRVAGNLPYNVSSPILFALIRALKAGAAIVDATLMVQREVAERIEAGPGTGDYGVIAVLIQLRADVRRVLTLPPGAFRPPPKVHSAVVRLTFRPPAVPLRDEALFEQMIRSVFTQRRKTLSNALKPFADSRQADVRQVLGEARIDGTRRPETLALAEFARLADLLAST